MKSALMIVTAIALTAVFGCRSTSERGGAPSRAEGFKINAPASMNLKQGESRTITVTLDRGDYFKQDVRLTARTSRQDLTIEPTDVTVRASDRPEAQMRLAAAPNAALGEYRVYLTGTPTDGVPTNVSFKVDVVAP